METLVPLTILAVLNLIAARKYSSMIPPTVGLTTECLKRRRRAENRCTIMILIMTTVIIVTRILDLIAATGQRTVSLGIYKVTKEMSVLITFFRQVTFLITFTTHSFDCVFIFGMDSNLRRIALKMLGSLQVRLKYFKII